MRKSINVIPFVLITTIIFALSIQAAQPTVGILAFTPKGATQSDAEAVRELVISELVKTGRLNVLDRENTKFLMAEQAFQQTGATDQENAVGIGKLLGAEFMIYGSLMKLGIDYVVTVNMVSVETAGIVNSSEKQFKDIAQARVAVQSAIYGIAMMKRKTGEKWSSGKTTAFTAGLLGGIGAAALGAIGFSKYNTAKGIDIDIQHKSDPREIADLKLKRDQGKASADIINAVAIVTGAVSLGLLIWSYYIPKNPVYEDIPWTSKRKNSEPEPEQEPEVMGETIVPPDTLKQDVVIPEAAPAPAPIETVVVFKKNEPLPVIAGSDTVQQVILPRMFVQRTMSAADTFPVRPTAERYDEDVAVLEDEFKEIEEFELKEAQRKVTPEPVDTNPDRNRSGIRFSGSTLWGDPQFYLNGTHYIPLKRASFTSGENAYANFSSGPLVRLKLGFVIKASPFINVEIGPAGLWQSMNVAYQSTTTAEKAKIEFTNGMIGVSPGVFYTRRITPFKLNAGIFADIGWGWLASSYVSVQAERSTSYSNTIFGTSSYQSNNWANAFGWGLGIRGGAEYLFNEHLGANLDLMFRFNRSGYTPNSQWFSNSDEDTHIRQLLGYTGTYTPMIDIIPPMFGLAVGLNAYY